MSVGLVDVSSDMRFLLGITRLTLIVNSSLFVGDARHSALFVRDSSCRDNSPRRNILWSVLGFVLLVGSSNQKFLNIINNARLCGNEISATPLKSRFRTSNFGSIGI